MSPAGISPDARAVVRALVDLTTQVRRLADARQSDFVLTPDAADDVPPTAVVDDRQPAYAAVYAYIRRLGDVMPTSRIDRNAIIWHAVNAALDVGPVAPATTCSARYARTGTSQMRWCIRAADHDEHHTDSSGFHWDDSHAVYPVANGVVKVSVPYPRPTEEIRDERAVREYEAAALHRQGVISDSEVNAVFATAEASVEAPAADEDAPNMLRVLADRAARGVLSLPGEGEALRRRVEQLINGREMWKGKAEEVERDRDEKAAEYERMRDLLRSENERANAAIERETALEGGS
ncbi:hypothetical protein ABZ890_39605 [Streptomyces sp. NPDC046984]|uniref:hypothetical protein n=1 Tax=Streptomyces sp. NPDC046984 TaxID=3155138 RepID=UPI0033F4A60E